MVFDRAWIVEPSDQSEVANETTGLSGACCGLVRVWARRLLTHPAESARLRMSWLKAHQQDAVAFQRSYKTIKSQAVKNAVQLGFRDQGEADRYGVEQAMAEDDILVDLDGRRRIDFPKLRFPPTGSTGHYAANPKWYFAKEGSEITANTMYFWDIGMEVQVTGRPHDLHACASRHLTDMEGQGNFQFYDPNLGELSVPCSAWPAFVEGWILGCANNGEPAVIIDHISLLPMRQADPRPSALIPLIYAAWNSGWFRSKSAASTHAIGRLQALARQGAEAELREAIRWYAGKITVDAGDVLKTKHGDKPAAKSKLRSLLDTRFASHTFFH